MYICNKLTYNTAALRSLINRDMIDSLTRNLRYDSTKQILSVDWLSPKEVRRWCVNHWKTAFPLAAHGQGQTKGKIGSSIHGEAESSLLYMVEIPAWTLGAIRFNEDRTHLQAADKAVAQSRRTGVDLLPPRKN